MINENCNNKKKAYTDCCDLHFLNIGPPLIGSAPEVNGRGSACHGDFLVATTGECIFHIGLICSQAQSKRLMVRFCLLFSSAVFPS